MAITHAYTSTKEDPADSTVVGKTKWNAAHIGTSTGAFPGATLLVAANDASQRSKDAADYVCDGSADQVQINAALAALPALGGTVLLAEGTYSIRTPIQILSSNQHLHGSGWRDNCRIFNESGYTPAYLIQVGTSSNLANNTVKHLGLDWTGSPVTGIGIYAASNMFRVEDVYIANAPEDGISLHSFITTEFAEQSIINVRMWGICRDAVVATSDIYDLVCQNVRVAGDSTTKGRYGFHLNGSYASLVNCRANTFPLGWGVKLVAAFQTKFFGCHFDDNGVGAAAAGFGENGQGGGGIDCDANSSAIISGCNFSANYSYDIFFAGGSGSAVTSCSMSGTAVDGPLRQSIYATGINHLVIADNLIKNAPERAITVAYSSQVNVHDNAIFNPVGAPTQASIRFYASNYCYIHDNICANGIVEDGASNHNLIAQNQNVGGSTSTVGAQTKVVAFLASD